MTRPIVNRDLLSAPGDRNAIGSPSLAYGSTDRGAHRWFHAGGDGGGGEETGTDGDGAYCGARVGNSLDIHGRLGAGGGTTGGADVGSVGAG
jgi:hypothetical protein